MGISFSISSDDTTYVFSLVKWGIIRKILSKIFRASPFQFTPSYELAVYKKEDGKIHLSHPYFAFHFSNKDIALSRMKWIKTLSEEGMRGIEKLIINLTSFDPKQEGVYIGPSEYVDWEISCNKKRVS